MGGGEKGHFNADEGVCKTKGNVFGVGVGSEARDDAHCNEEGYSYGLPKGEEEDAFDAEEFGDRTLEARIMRVGVYKGRGAHRKGFKSW